MEKENTKLVVENHSNDGDEDVGEYRNSHALMQIGKEVKAKLSKIKGYSISLRDPSIKKTLVKERNALVDKIIFSKDNVDTSNLSENQLFQ